MPCAGNELSDIRARGPGSLETGCDHFSGKAFSIVMSVPLLGFQGWSAIGRSDKFFPSIHGRIPWGR